MKKVLFCASTVSHIKNFHLPYIQAFKERGWEVDIAVDQQAIVEDVRKVVGVNFKKNMFSLNNIKALFKIRRMIKEEQYDVISVHTTLASAVVRLAVMFLKNRPKIIYTCHGYLFEKDRGIKNKIYLGIEKLCASVTDTLLVMNHRDLEIASEYKLYRNEVHYIQGMGIQLDRFKPVSKEKKDKLRLEKGFSKEDIIYTYVAEFSKRKNHKLLIEVFKELANELPHAKLVLIGNGALLEETRKWIKSLNLDQQIILTGYCKDVVGYYQISDVCLSSSLIEGLPFNIMEAMASQLPIIASDIKGHKELVQHGENGYLYDLDNKQELQQYIVSLYKDCLLRERFGKESSRRVKKFNLEDVLNQNMALYEQVS